MGNLYAGLILTDPDKKGTEKQCVALANALQIEHLDILYPQFNKLPLPGVLKPKYLYSFATVHQCKEFLKKDVNIIIVSGRRSAKLGAYLHSLGYFVVFILKPPVSCKHFNVVLIPEHDRPMGGSNVISTFGALHHITPDFLRVQQHDFKHNYPEIYHHLIPPCAQKAAVLIGGNNKFYHISLVKVKEWCQQFMALAHQGWGLMITVSRRTPNKIKDVMCAHLQHPLIKIWSGEGPNPYELFLSHADAILVTPDSVSMMSESAGTGKPLYGLELHRRRRLHPNKFDQFVLSLTAQKIYRPFEGKLDSTLGYSFINSLPKYTKRILEIYQQWQENKLLKIQKKKNDKNR